MELLQPRMGDGKQHATTAAGVPALPVPRVPTRTWRSGGRESASHRQNVGACVLNITSREAPFKWFVPCLNNRCHVVKDGREVPSRMQLVIRTVNDWQSEWRMLDHPLYKCEQPGCELHTHPREARTITRWSIKGRGQFKSNEGLDHTEYDNLI